MTPERGILPRQVLTESERGNLAGLDDALEALAQPPDPVAAAWRSCLQAVRWFFDPVASAGPAVGEVAVFADAPAEAQGVAAETCVQMERMSLLAFDRPALAAWTALHRTLVGSRGDAAALVPLRTAEHWLRLLGDEGAASEEEAAALVREAAEAGVASAVVEATVLAALGRSLRGDLPGAVDAARRAARMAQAEELAYPDYLAHLVLARVRRLAGRPHLALHILTALARAAPAGWQPWLAWEIALSGGEKTAPALLPEALGRAALSGWSSTRACRALYAVLARAREGDRAALARAAAELPLALRGFRGLAAEARVLLFSLKAGLSDSPDLAALPAIVSDVEEWCRGASGDIPLGLHALGGTETAGRAREGALAYVLALPGEPGRRMLRLGLGLVTGARNLESQGGAERGGVRTDTGIAVLALAGPSGLTREEFFRAVYLFSFAPEVHQSVLDLLVLRMRRRLGPLGEIVRRESDHALVLRVEEPLLVPDARCDAPAADRLLRALAATGPVTADEAAKKLRISSRTVRRVFQQLLEEGALSQERLGHQIAYRVHDTTFTQVARPGRPP